MKDFGLSHAEFPNLVEQASFNAGNYFVSQVFRAPSHPDHMPLQKVEDLFSGDAVMIGCLVTLLLKRWNRVHKSNPQEPFLQKILGVIQRHKLTPKNVSPTLKQLLADV